MPSTPVLDAAILWPAWKKDEDYDSYSYAGKPDYADILSAFGQVVLSRSDHDYQGDTYAIIEREGAWGFLTFGWGSCSGCDALEAANNPESLTQLARELWDGIQWFGARYELDDWLRNRDWGSQFSWYHREALMELLSAELGTEVAAQIEAKYAEKEE